MLALTASLWYVSTLAHTPPCGCMGLTHIVLPNRQNPVAGSFRNVVIPGLLKFADDYCTKSPWLAKAGS